MKRNSFSKIPLFHDLLFSNQFLFIYFIRVCAQLDHPFPLLCDIMLRFLVFVHQRARSCNVRPNLFVSQLCVNLCDPFVQVGDLKQCFESCEKERNHFDTFSVVSSMLKIILVGRLQSQTTWLFLANLRVESEAAE